MTKITLDAETFKALASSTRLTVLRALDERRKTLTELARDLQLNKATVHEHLALLTAADLVKKRDDEGRKWIYYELTWRGQKLLHPQETTTFSVLLGLGVVAAGGGFAMLGKSLGWWLQEKAAAMEASEPADTDAAAPSALRAEDSMDASSSESGSPSAAGGAGAEQMDDAWVAPPVEEAMATDDADDGTWLSVAVLGLGALLTILAVLLRRHIRPGPLRADAPTDDAPDA